MTRKFKDISKESVDLYFCYDQHSPTKLKWRVDLYSGKNLNRLQAREGEVAGSYDKQSDCYKVGLNGEKYLVHRIVYCLLNGSIPDDLEVDHKDGNRLNNSPCNLRLVTSKLNARNSKFRSNNTSGIHGVGKYARRSGQVWMAQWQDADGKPKQASFSVSKYGNEGAKCLAIKARQDAIDKLNESGAGYSERHGT